MLPAAMLPLAKGFEPQTTMVLLRRTSAKARLPKVAMPLSRWGMKHSLAAEQRFADPYALRNRFMQNMAMQFLT